MPISLAPARRRTLLLSALSLAAAAFPARATAQEGGGAVLRGQVLTTDEVPVAGVNVTLAAPGAPARQVTTGDDGRFFFAPRDTGRAVLRLRRIGFRPDSVAVTLPRSDSAAVVVRLAFVPQALTAVVVEGRATDRRPPQIAEFYRRQSRGMGRFITRAQIEQRRPLRTTDLLRSLPGMAVYGDGGATAVRYRSSRCAPEVYLDGLALTAGPVDLDAFAPSSLEGIEVHSLGTVPVEYSRAFGRSSCGTVLLWSRYGEPRPRRSREKPVTSEELAQLVDAVRIYTAAQVDSAARPPEDFGARFALADSARVSGTVSVIAEFVVDAEGRVEPATVNVVASPHPTLSDAVRAALPGARFTPALRGGRPVRQLVQVAVRFDEKDGAARPAR